jgi:hypothetical protein
LSALSGQRADRKKVFLSRQTPGKANAGPLYAWEATLCDRSRPAMDARKMLMIPEVTRSGSRRLTERGGILNTGVNTTANPAAVSKPVLAIQAYARLTGALIAVSILAGIFGELYVPAKMIELSDAAATAKNITSGGELFHLGFASYLVEALCDVALTLLFYVLLRPVHRNIALLAVFFGMISTATYAIAEFFYAAAPFAVGDESLLKAFSVDQRDALALLLLKLYSYGGEIFMVFYGVTFVLRGYLVIRSTFLPTFLGVLMVIAGAGFIVKNFTLLLMPAYASDLFLLPMFVSAVALALWLLIKGVNASRWHATMARWPSET